jgi:acyl carrier protein
MSSNVPISLDEFRGMIARHLHIEESRVTAESTFVEDLFADSIRLVELMFALEKQGITIPMEEAWNVKTVGDAYRVYSHHARGSTPAADT